MRKPAALSPRQHPDVFTAAEAALYLHLDPEEGERTLETLRAKHGLTGQKIGKAYFYHRRHLDALADRLFGIALPLARSSATR